jgi:DamX protein
MREEWLLRQNPNAYTLQLVALGEEAGISRFLERFSLPGQAAYFRTMRQGKPWFSLLYGVYPDRQAALAARARLPAELQHSDVWPRSLASVQEEIRNR